MVKDMIIKSVILIIGIITLNIIVFSLMFYPIFPYESWFPTPILGGFAAGLVVGLLTKESKESILFALLSGIFGYIAYTIFLSLYLGWFYNFTIIGFALGLGWGTLVFGTPALCGAIFVLLIKTLIKEKRN